MEESQEIERKDYFHQFMKDVELELKRNGTSYVFSQQQLEYLQKKYDIKVINKDECCIYIGLKKGK